MPEPTSPAPHVLVVVHDPATGEIIVTAADRPGETPTAPPTVAGLLRAAAMTVAMDHGINSREALVEFLAAHPQRLRIAAGMASELSRV